MVWNLHYLLNIFIHQILGIVLGIQRTTVPRVAWLEGITVKPGLNLEQVCLKNLNLAKLLWCILTLIFPL